MTSDGSSGNALGAAQPAVSSRRGATPACPARPCRARRWPRLLALLAWAALTSAARATTVYIGATSASVPMAITTDAGSLPGAFWTGRSINWIAVNGLNDLSDYADGSVGDIFDFVGSVTSPGFYWAKDANYVYMRMRVDVGAVTPTLSEYSGTIWAYINISGGTTPEYAFAWDSKTNETSFVNHGLEMQDYLSSGGAWADLKMADVDDAPTARGAADINGLDITTPITTDFRTEDGYIRITDSQSTTDFGSTTLIDFAVRWGYLTANTTLTSSQSWSVQLASANARHDHNFIDVDVAGGLSPASAFSANDFKPLLVPEPSMGLLALAAFGLLAGRRPRRRAA